MKCLIKEYFNIKRTHRIVLFIFFSICVMILDILIVYLSGKFVDRIITKQSIDTIIKFCMQIILCYIVTVFMTYCYQIISAELREKLSFDITAKVIRHIQKVPLLEIKKYEPAYLTQRIFSDSSDIINFVLDNVVNMIVNVAILFYLLFYVIKTNKNIFVAFIFFLPIYCLIYLLSKKGITKRTKGVNEKQNIYYQRLYEQIRLCENIKTEGTFEESKYSLHANFDTYISSFMKYTKFNSAIKSIESLTSYAFYAILLVYGAIEIINGNLTIGGFTIINAYFSKSINILNFYMGIGKSIQHVKVSYERLQELMEIEIEVNGSCFVENINQIDFRNLSYSYPQKSNLLISNFNYIFSKGKIYVIEGKNGIGKSTFINLLINILDSLDNVYFNNINVKDLDMYKIRRNKIAVLRQKIEFPFEVIGNLIDIQPNTFYNTDIENLVKEIFFSDNFNIEQYKNIYPDKMSGGEKQKVYILKTLLKDADVIIMDEPTAALDEISSNKIYQLIQAIKYNKIIIIVTHDKKFVKIADEVLKF